MIGESVLGEVLLRCIDDSDTWCTLSRVSKRFYHIAKRLLVKKTEIISSSMEKAVYTELPTGVKHGLYQTFLRNDRRDTEVYFKNGGYHGEFREWYLTGQIYYQRNYLNNKLHGAYMIWSDNGQLQYMATYYNGQLI